MSLFRMLLMRNSAKDVIILTPELLQMQAGGDKKNLNVRANKKWDITIINNSNNTKHGK